MPIDDDFIDRILEGEVSERELAEFQQWLEVPANLQRFTLRAELYSDLRRSLLRQHIQSTALAKNSGVTVPDSVSPQEPLAPPVIRTRWTVLAAIGLVTAACLLVAFIRSTELGGPAPTDATDVFAASVVSNVSGLLTKSETNQNVDQPWQQTNLPAGTYHLQTGLLHLQFGGGVMVYVEAPAHFDAVSDKRVVLHGGRLSARVPPEGIGFTVETPEAEVVDFGTEFSVDVEGGASEVHVFDGLVRVHPGASDQRDEAKSIDLRASHALRIADGTAVPKDISLAAERFIRNFDEPRLKYARAVKHLAPLAFYRMPIRDRGLVSEPPEYSGVVVTGEGKRPPHAKGVFVGGSLRVGADSTGRGGRVDSPPPLESGNFSLAVFVYLETPGASGIVATNRNGIRGGFTLSLDQAGQLQASIRSGEGNTHTATGKLALPPKTWRHVVVTADGRQLKCYEDGKLVATTACSAMASDPEAIWFGANAQATQVWNGRIDEVALFDRALTEEEISGLYRTAQEEIARSR